MNEVIKRRVFENVKIHEVLEKIRKDSKISLNGLRTLLDGVQDSDKKRYRVPTLGVAREIARLTVYCSLFT